MATLVNGNGNVAVYAQQDADLLTGALGASTRIMNVGSKMAYTIEDANTIAVADGVILTKEGRRIQVDVGNVDEFTIPTGSAGVTRYYIIGYHLYTDGSANQKCETFVQLMENGSETITENTFRNGASEVYVSLYRVKQIGLNLDTITALLSVGIALTDMTDVIGDTDISGIGDGTLTGGLNAVNQNLTELSEDVSATFEPKWTNTTTAGTNITLPSDVDWNLLVAEIDVLNNSQHYAFTYNIKRLQNSTVAKYYMAGCYYNSSNYWNVALHIAWDTLQAHIASSYFGTTQKIQDSTLTVNLY